MLMNHRSMQANAAARMRGITLIELMIVIVVLSILSALAYPSYQNQVREARRADGLAMLMQRAHDLERCYTLFSSYTDANCTVPFPSASLEGHYSVTVARTASTYTLSAAPQGVQTSDAQCGTLTLSSNGANGGRGSLGVANVDANGCW